MTPNPQLTALQLSILRVLWERGEARVPEVCDGLKTPRPLAKNTIATVLSRLEKQGIVAHRTEGRQFVYRALIEEQDAQGLMVGEFAERVFEGNMAKMFAHLLDHESMAPGDLDQIRAMIAEREDSMSEEEEA